MGRQSFSSGTESLDFVALAIQPLAVMHWFLAAAAGQDARRDALLEQHLTDFVPVIPLIPDHRCRRRQILAQHISTGEVAASPLTQVESQGTTFAVTDPMELAGYAPLVPPIRRGAPPLC